MKLKKLFEDSLPRIKRLMQQVCRKKRFSPADCEDFCSWAVTRLIENDYQKLAGYRGRGPFRCYLATVIARLGMDYCDKLWGKWRPTAAARRLGRAAIALERLLIRDQLAWSEAVQSIQESQGVSEERLETIYALLPNRPVRRLEDEKDLHLVASQSGNPHRELLAKELKQQWLVVEQLLEKALSSLTEEENLILKLHFRDGIPLSKISQMLDLEENIYHLKDRILRRLRQDLEDEGIQPEVLRLLFEGRLE